MYKHTHIYNVCFINYLKKKKTLVKDIKQTEIREDVHNQSISKKSPWAGLEYMVG